jgi:hypothetical protein
MTDGVDQGILSNIVGAFLPSEQASRDAEDLTHVALEKLFPSFGVTRARRLDERRIAGLDVGRSGSDVG